MPDDETKASPAKTPEPSADPVATLTEETPLNYDGQPPPKLPTPPGQEAPKS